MDRFDEIPISELNKADGYKQEIPESPKEELVDREDVS